MATRPAKPRPPLAAIEANALAVEVLKVAVAGAVGRIVEEAETLATGDWRRLGNDAAPGVSFRLVAGWCDIAVEWADVQMVTEGATIVVSINATTIPFTVADGAADRRFGELAEITRLRALNGLRIAQVITGETTTVLLSDERRTTLTAG